ncbi:MAG: InlB B-repeat-containing protein [Rubrivivax sp.]
MPPAFRLPRTARRLAVGACLGAALAGVWAQPMPKAEHAQLAQTATTKGTVRVIVGLNLPAALDQLLPAAQMLQQRQAIRDTQTSTTLQALMGTASQVKAQFDTVPYMAIEADATALARLRSSPLVREIYEDKLSRPHLVRSTPLIGATTAWTGGRNGNVYAVAVLDTGVDKTHPFLSGKVVSEACYSTTSAADGAQSLCPGGAASSVAAGAAAPCGGGLCNHGTHVAGIAAGGLDTLVAGRGAQAPDGSNGVARSASIVAIQIYSLFPNYYGPGQGAVLSYESDQVKGLERVYALSASTKIAAANLSLGNGKYTETCDLSFPALKTAIDNLRAAGIPTIIASGNAGYRDGISGPACVSTAISVGATCDLSNTGTCATGVNGVASFSNIASFLSLVAPGSSISSSVPGGTYAVMDGTSMAAPHVAGAWAMLKQAQPTLSVTDALAQLRANAMVVNDTRSSSLVTGLRRLSVGFLGSTGTTFALQVRKAGLNAAQGSVSSSPAGITCGATCEAPFASTASVTLTASAPVGTTFGGWSGGCTGTATTCTVAMSQVRAVTATFNPAQVALSVTADRGTSTASGSVAASPSATGLPCSTPATAGTASSVCTANYAFNASVTLTATPGAGSTFSGWGGACTGTGSCTVAMSAARSVTATFTLAPQTLTVTSSRGTTTGAGTVSSSPAGMSCATPTAAGVSAANCSANFSNGTNVTLTATPAAGSAFTGWSGACTGTATTCTLAMTAARSVTANFAPATASFTLTINASRGTSSASGSVSSAPAGLTCATPTVAGQAQTTCTGSYSSGTAVTLTASAATGSTFTGWSGGCTGTAATCTVTMSAAQTVTANFGLATTPPASNTLTVNSARAVTAAGGSVSSNPTGISCAAPATGTTMQATCTASYASTASVTLTATPTAGSVFSGWSGGACSGTATTCTVSMSAARTVTATFTQRFALSLSVTKARAVSSGTVSSSPTGLSCGTAATGTTATACTANFDSGTSVVLTATPATGTTFTGWSGSCTGTARTCTVPMSAARSATAAFN